MKALKKIKVFFSNFTLSPNKPNSLVNFSLFFTRTTKITEINIPHPAPKLHLTFLLRLNNNKNMRLDLTCKLEALKSSKSEFMLRSHDHKFNNGIVCVNKNKIWRMLTIWSIDRSSEICWRKTFIFIHPAFGENIFTRTKSWWKLNGKTCRNESKTLCAGEWVLSKANISWKLFVEKLFHRVFHHEKNRSRPKVEISRLNFFYSATSSTFCSTNKNCLWTLFKGKFFYFSAES